MVSRSRLPRGALAPFARSLWTVSGSRPQAEWLLPRGEIDVLVEVGGPRAGQLLVSGPWTRPRRLEASPAAAVVGVTLAPGAGPAVLGIPVEACRNAHVPLEQFWGTRAARGGDAIAQEPSAARRMDALERVLLGALIPAPEWSTALTAATALLERDLSCSVASLSTRSGIGERRLQQIAEQGLGMALKRYQRVVRFQRTVTWLTAEPQRELAEIAYAAGYSDQAHFTNQFREHSAMAPTAFLRTPRPHRNHVQLARALSCKTPGDGAPMLAP